MIDNFSLLDDSLTEKTKTKKIESAKDRATALVKGVPVDRIKTRTEYEKAGQVVAQAKVFRKEWTEFMEPIKKATKAAHKAACDRYNEIDNVLEDVIDRTTPFLVDFEDWHTRYQAEKEAETNAVVKAEGFDPLVVTLPKLTAPEGLSRRTEWRAEVTNLMDLVKAVADGRAPLAYLEPNMKVLNMQARALKTELQGRIPGVEPVTETAYALRES